MSWKVEKEPAMHVTEATWKGHTLRDSNSVIAWKRQNCGTVERSGVARGWVMERMTRRSPGDFPGSETALCATVVVDTRHHAFIQTHSMYKSDPDVRRVISDKCPIWWGADREGGRAHVCVWGVYRGNLCTFLSILLKTWNCSKKKKGLN